MPRAHHECHSLQKYKTDLRTFFFVKWNYSIISVGEDAGMSEAVGRHDSVRSTTNPERTRGNQGHNISAKKTELGLKGEQFHPQKKALHDRPEISSENPEIASNNGRVEFSTAVKNSKSGFDSGTVSSSR
jgi:hypothetical protein